MPVIYRKPKKRENTENRTERKKYYSTARWKKLRLEKLMNCPTCECQLCAASGVIVPATQVHHIISFLTGKDEADKQNLFYDYNNLMSVSDVCHGKIHASQQK